MAAMSDTKIIVLGVGNILLKDEGVGVHAIHELQREKYPANVSLIDGATAGLDLLPIFQEATILIIVDCVKGGGEPGSLYRFTPTEIKDLPDSLKTSLHDFNLVDVMNLAKAFGSIPDTIVIIGVEPLEIEWGLEMTAPIQAVFPRLLDVVRNEIDAAIHGKIEAEPTG